MSQNSDDYSDDSLQNKPVSSGAFRIYSVIGPASGAFCLKHPNLRCQSSEQGQNGRASQKPECHFWRPHFAHQVCQQILAFCLQSVFPNFPLLSISTNCHPVKASIISHLDHCNCLSGFLFPFLLPKSIRLTEARVLLKKQVIGSQGSLCSKLLLALIITRPKWRSPTASSGPHEFWPLPTSWPYLIFLFSLTLLCHVLNTSSDLLSQGLCILSSLCLECSSPRPTSSQGVIILFQFHLKCQLLRESWRFKSVVLPLHIILFYLQNSTNSYQTFFLFMGLLPVSFTRM